jgi:hypothetical protein
MLEKIVYPLTYNTCVCNRMVMVVQVGACIRTSMETRPLKVSQVRDCSILRALFARFVLGWELSALCKANLSHMHTARTISMHC